MQSDADSQPHANMPSAQKIYTVSEDPKFTRVNLKWTTTKMFITANRKKHLPADHGYFKEANKRKVAKAKASSQQQRMKAVMRKITVMSEKTEKVC